MRRHAELKTVSARQPETAGKEYGATKPAGTAAYETRGQAQPAGGEVSVVSPFREMERWFEEAFNRPFFGFNWAPFRQMAHEFGATGEMAPSCDVYEEGGQFVVKAELPGISRDEINLKVVDNNLVITGEKKSEEKIERSNYSRLERYHGSFSRSIALPEGLDTEHVKATCKDGILEVRIPRTEQSQVRQIKVE
jgi:HSP20 family protein